jgi:hypothetical protein
LAPVISEPPADKDSIPRKVKLFSRTRKRCYFSARRRRQLLDLS